MTSSSDLVRWGGLAAMVGAVLGIVSSPFYAVAYFSTEDGAESLEAPWVAAWSGAFRDLFGPLLTFAPSEAVYLTYGKVLTFVFLGWLALWRFMPYRPRAQGGWRSGAFAWPSPVPCWAPSAASVPTG